MLDSLDAIFIELDLTLDQLIRNATMLQNNNILTLLDQAEQKLLKRTQESLLAKFFHTQELLHTTQSKKKNRLQKLEEKHKYLNTLFSLEDFSKSIPSTPIIGKVRIGRNRKKHKDFVRN